MRASHQRKLKTDATQSASERAQSHLFYLIFFFRLISYDRGSGKKKASHETVHESNNKIKYEKKKYIVENAFANIADTIFGHTTMNAFCTRYSIRK